MISGCYAVGLCAIAAYVFLALKGQAVGNHGDAFAIGGLALDAADGIAEV